MEITSQERNQIVQTLWKLKHYVKESQSVEGRDLDFVRGKIIQEVKILKERMQDLGLHEGDFKRFLVEEFESMGDYRSIREILYYLDRYM
jgi:hypothetical protein